MEDVRYIARFLEFMLEKEGYSVAVAYSGEQALESIESFRPDGVLLDLMLPGISGLDVLKHIRSQELHRDTIVIVLTARPFEETPSEILESGANTHCVKPVAPSTLMRTLLEFGLPPLSRTPIPLENEGSLEYAHT